MIAAGYTGGVQHMAGPGTIMDRNRVPGVLKTMRVPRISETYKKILDRIVHKLKFTKNYQMNDIFK
jgi:hypothetical protein